MVTEQVQISFMKGGQMAKSKKSTKSLHPIIYGTQFRLDTKIFFGWQC